MNIWRRHDARRNWRTNLAFLIAGQDLYDWRSKHNRIVAKMAEGAAQARIIKSVEGLAYTDEQGHEMISEFKSDLIALIKGKQK